MVAVEPFSGHVARAERVSEVVSPAYDALTVAQRRQYRVDNPLSYLHVTRSAPDEDDAATVDNTTLVQRGRAALERLLDAEVFAPAEAPAYLVYELATDDHAQRGLVCEVPGPEFRLRARPHEATQPARAALLAEHFLTVKAASSPVACTVADGADLEQLLATLSPADAQIEHIGDDGLTQRIWTVTEPTMTAAIEASLAGIDLYIIDGHHRAAANGQILERDLAVPLLVTIFPPESLRLTGFHRLVELPSDMDEAEFIRRVARRFSVTTTPDLVQPEPGSVAIGAAGAWHMVHFDERPRFGSAQVRLGSLDPTVVEREIIRSIVGRDQIEPRVEYMPDDGEKTSVVAHAAEAGLVPILVPAVAVADMVEVADGGLIMPAKSTYFVPKVRSGLFLRRYEAELGERPS